MSGTGYLLRHWWLLILIVFASCTSGDLIRVDSMNFDQQVDMYQNLEFTFNHDLVSDSLLNRMDSSSYISFTPAINGRFQWTGVRSLVFLPATPFAPNTDYSLKIRPDISKYLAKKLLPEDKEIRFHTPYLAVERSQSYWSLDENDKSLVQLRIKLFFNHKVDLNTLRKLTSVKLDNKAVAVTLLTRENTNEIEFSIAAPSNEMTSKPLTLTIAKGMTCIGSSRANPDETVVNMTMPQKDRIEITDVQTEFEEGEGAVYIYTTQPAVEQGLRGLVTVKPDVTFTASTIGNAIKLKGNFADGQTYNLTISGKLKGIFGPELGDDYQQTIIFGALEPYIAFSDQSGMYLSTGGSGNLGINIINVPKVKVTVFRVFENNIQHFMRQGKQWNWNYEDDDYQESYAYSLNEDYGKVISTREIDTRSLPRKGNIKLLNIRPEQLELSSDMKGIYLIKVESTEKSWLSDVQLLSYSDIGLIVKEGVDEMFVVARSIATAQPLPGVIVRFISRNNQQVHQLTTNSNGIAEFKNVSKTIPGFNIAMITARKGEDFNMLLFSRSQVETSRFDVGGKRTAGMNYDVFIYGDRNLYRPGDSVFCNAVVRNFQWETIQDIPVKFRVIGPDGKDFITRRAQLSKSGAAQLSFSLPNAALTGSYVVEVLSSNDVLIGNTRIGVEEFMPDRIKVVAKTDKTSYLNGETLKATTNVNNLFGPPAANRKVENEFRVSRKSYTAKGYENYNFNITTTSDVYFQNMLNDGYTDEKGINEQTFNLPAFSDIGLLTGRLFTTAFDETGRPVNRYSEVEIITQNTFYGIGPVPGWVATSRPLKVNTIALDRRGKTVKGKARLEIVNIVWQTVLERNYGNTSYRSQRKEKVVLSRDINIADGGYIVQFSPPASGQYEIRISSGQTSNYVTRSFYAYGWADAGMSSFQVNREGEIGIETDKELYKPGETARVLFKTPFAGELIVTVEQDKVLEYFSLPATAEGASLDLKVAASFMPNAYISATLIRKIDNSGLPLTVAHGFTSIKVEEPQRKIAVSIEAPEKQRSKRNQLIRVKATPGAEVTIAAVDEGILQITGYNSPDPYSYFYQKRALEVNSYDLFDELFPELSSGNSSSGGDRGFDMGKRINPLTTKRVKLLARWSGTLKADAGGYVSFNLPIPQFSGAVRIMAVAYKGNEFGSAEKEMKVADPLVISSSLPRFLSPDDQAMVAVTLTNTTNKTLNVKISTKSSGPVVCGKIQDASLSIPANSEKMTSYLLDAEMKIGIAHIKLIAEAGGEQFTEETDISVRPAVTLEKTGTAGQIKAGEKLELKAETDFMPGTAKSKLLITTSPAGKYSRNLSELINYPHGCLEQSISAAFPQLYFSDLAKMLKQTPRNSIYDVTQNVQEAIYRVEGMQQYNGGLVYWPENYSTISWWGTAYGGHFLYEASKAGYATNPKVLENINRYLTEMVKQKSTTEYFYRNRSGTWQKIPQANRETFYSLYVLALSGKQHLPTMNYYKARLNELSLDSRYMLACAYALAGDKRSFETVLPKVWDEKEAPGYMTGGSFSSPIRDKAIALYTLITADPDNPQVALLTRQVGEMINSTRWLSTQESVFSMLALGKLAGMAKAENLQASVEVAGKKVATFNGEDINVDVTGTSANISTSGKGTIFYYMESEGIPLSGKSREEDRVLRVRRTMLTRNGNAVNDNDIRQNDLIVVAVSISTTDNSTIENVAITDILPAGFEIENPRLNNEREMEWIKNRSTPDYQDMRDDRITFFTTASGQTRTFYYMVRAVSTGIFVQGPVGADAMYNGQYYSYSGAGRVIVR